MFKKDIKKAFTMAEAILVMTILGIIATIMITTLKPAEFKEKGLRILAKKVLSEIDTATTQILVNNSSKNNMATLYVAGATTTQFAMTGDNHANMANLYKGYLTTTRQTSTNCAGLSAGTQFFLKDGACMGVASGTTNTLATCFPGEETATNVNVTYGYLYFDTNGDEEPNAICRDRFVLPFDISGIKYDI